MYVCNGGVNLNTNCRFNYKTTFEALIYLPEQAIDESFLLQHCSHFHNMWKDGKDKRI